jgi:hypothetical protein
MKRATLAAVALSILTMMTAPACAQSGPTSQPTTRPDPDRAPAGGKQTTAQKMQDVFKKQDQTKKALRDRAMAEASAYADPAGDQPPPPTPAELLADAQLKLDTEVARHETRLGDLRRAEADARAAGDRKTAQRVRKDIESENTAFQRTSADLRKALRECQARVDAEARR